LYQQIKALLLGSLQSGEWRPGAPIPSEMELAARYEVSQGTVRKAIDELATENLLIRHQGKGTFVASHHSEAWQYRFFSLMPDSGKKAPLKSHFLACKPIKSPSIIAQLLKTPASEQVFQIDRVQSLGGEVAVFEFAGNTYLYGAGTTADAATDFLIELTGVVGLGGITITNGVVSFG
jgi:GntR family transcriptional regulator